MCFWIQNCVPHNSIAAFLREFSLYHYYLLAIAVLQGVKVFSLLGCKYLVKEVRSFVSVSVVESHEQFKLRWNLSCY